MIPRPARWIVIENTPGYMPDSEPAGFPTLAEAVAYALSLARELRENGYRVRGSKVERRWFGEQDRDDLGRVITIEPAGLSE